ncbi:hypothetical protein [Metamycoplasma neophronis]|uniref:Uncharacterized protein n=1 Tax=Metamycoplasma neophronis TaxID=872983 RepID=A0ABY2Z4P4_9BACT|nr:hypothetical protein [Metamycoplasma neophronis]TPR54646.1 hypothetical protein FJR74_00010 [Metamycoplasma neophronis]
MNNDNKLFIQLTKSKRKSKVKRIFSIIGIILSTVVALAIVAVAIYGLIEGPIALASKGI